MDTHSRIHTYFSLIFRILSISAVAFFLGEICVSAANPSRDPSAKFANPQRRQGAKPTPDKSIQPAKPSSTSGNPGSAQDMPTTPPPSGATPPAASPTPVVEKFTFQPRQVTRSSNHTLVIKSSDCATSKFEDKEKAIANLVELKDTRGFEITNAQLTQNKCEFSADLKVTQAAGFGLVRIFVNYKEGETAKQESIMINVANEEATPPGPLPPGLSPQVDVMWGVVPQKIVKDNFGRRVGQNFYCIEIVIGNNTGYELQIASVAFELGPIGDAAKYMAQKLKQATTDLGNSSAISEAIQAGDLASTQAGMALEAEADAEIQKLNMEAAGDAKQKAKHQQMYEAKKARAEQLRAQAQQLELVAQEKHKLAVAVVSSRVELVKSQAEHMTNLSRVAYAQRLPVNSYVMTRGSLEHGQIWSPRNFVLNGIKAFGPFLTGFLPFFHVVNHRANFSEGINILSNPLEKGFEALMPDETIDQLQRLDDQILRDGLMIPNNRHLRTRVFIAKDSLRLKKDFDGNDMRDDPMMVTLALGKLHLIGHTVEYLNRVNVTTGPTGEVVPPPTVNPDSYQKNYDLAGDEAPATFSLTGTSLKNAIVTADDPNIEIPKDKVVTTNTSLTAEIKVKDTARLGQHILTVTNARSSVQIPIEVRQPYPAAPQPSSVSPLGGLAAEEIPYDLNLSGRFLQGADLVPDPASNPLTARDVKASPDGKSLKAKIVVPRKTPPGEYAFKVTNEQHKVLTDAALPRIKIKLGAPTAPKVTGPAQTEPKDLVHNPATTKTYTLKLQGENLQNVTSVETQPASQMTFSDLSPSTNGKELTLKLTVPKEQLPATYQVKLKAQLPAGSDPAALLSEEFALTVKKQPALEVTSPKDPVTVKLGEELKLVVVGSNLEKAAIKLPDGWTAKPLSPAEAATGTLAETAGFVVNADGTRLNGTILIPAAALPDGTAEKLYNLEIKNSDKDAQPKIIQVKVTRP